LWKISIEVFMQNRKEKLWIFAVLHWMNNSYGNFRLNCNLLVTARYGVSCKPTLKLCYTRIIMKSPREYWPRWAETLRRYQLHELAAMLLQAGTPIALLGAQALYFSRGLIRNDQLMALALTLEEDTEARAFASFLVEEKLSL
jgi:hypothetical protein